MRVTKAVKVLAKRKNDGSDVVRLLLSGTCFQPFAWTELAPPKWYLDIRLHSLSLSRRRKQEGAREEAQSSNEPSQQVSSHGESHS